MLGLLTGKGKKPPRVRTLEEAQQRVAVMRGWVQGPVNKTLSFFVQTIFAVLGIMHLKVFNRTTVYGREHLQDLHPPCLYVSNHLTMIDDFLLDPLLFGPIALKRLQLSWFPWHVPEEKNFFLNPVLSWLLQKAQAVPITRGHGAFQPGMMRLKEVLADGGIVHIYPEGTRSRTGNINPGKAGTGKLAYETRCRILPVYHEGTQNLLPVGSNRLRVGKKVAIVVGEAIEMDDLYALEANKATYQQIADRIIDAIRDLRRSLHEQGNNVLDISPEWLAETSEDDARDRRPRNGAHGMSSGDEDSDDD